MGTSTQQKAPLKKVSANTEAVASVAMPTAPVVPPEVNPVGKPEAKVAVKPAKPDVKSVAQPAAKQETKPETKSETKSETKPAPKSEAKPVVKAATKAVAPTRSTKTTAVAKPAAASKEASAVARKKVVVVADGKEKAKKAKLVRDSFTMPEAEYAALGEVKKACLKAGFEVKKSELLRIGVGLIRAMDVAVLKNAVATLAPLKPGRPRKEK